MRSTRLSIVLSVSLFASGALAETVVPKSTEKGVAKPETFKDSAPAVPETEKATAQAEPPIASPSVEVKVESDTNNTDVSEVVAKSKQLFMPDDTKKLCVAPCTLKLTIGKQYTVGGGVSQYQFTATKEMKTLRVDGDAKMLSALGWSLVIGSGALASVAGGIATAASSDMDKAKNEYDNGKLSLSGWRSRLDSAGGLLDVGVGVLVVGGISLVAGIVVLIAAPGTNVKVNGTKKSAGIRSLPNGFTF
jgi:hypothetical protein